MDNQNNTNNSFNIVANFISEDFINQLITIIRNIYDKWKGDYYEAIVRLLSIGYNFYDYNLKKENLPYEIVRLIDSLENYGDIKTSRGVFQFVNYKDSYMKYFVRKDKIEEFQNYDFDRFSDYILNQYNHNVKEITPCIIINGKKIQPPATWITEYGIKNRDKSEKLLTIKK